MKEKLQRIRKMFGLKIGRSVPWDSLNVHSQGLCFASLHCTDMRKLRYASTHGAYLRDEAMPNNIHWYVHSNYPNEHAYQL